PEHLSRRDALRLAGQLSALVESCLREPESPLSELSFLSAAERQQLLREWNDSAAQLPAPALLHRRFEDQALRAPDAPAVEHAAAARPYGELDRRAERLAQVLAASGVGPERRVLLYLRRGLDLVVSLLATLKAGGAYVPVEATSPAGRLSAILADCRPAFI